MPRTASEVKSVLGLDNYSKRSGAKDSNSKTPLVNLTKPDTPFEMTEECLKAFEILNCRLKSAPVLNIADEIQPYNLICNASGYGAGAFDAISLLGVVS